MANFWRVLLNTSHGRATQAFGQQNGTLVEWQQYEDFRANALGDFRDLLQISIDCVSMRLFLDLHINNNLSAPNENYARELLELHTMGVEEAGVPNYTDNDIKLLGQALVGLGFNQATATPTTTLQSPTPPAVTLFSTIPHVVNLTLQPSNNPAIKAGLVLDHLASQRQTALYICRRLIMEFVTDEEADFATPEIQALLATCMSKWGTRGNIREVLNALFKEKVFRTEKKYRRNKIEQPSDSVASGLRAVGSPIPPSATTTEITNLTTGLTILRNRLNAMGQELFLFPSPDGYPLSSYQQAGSSRARLRYQTAAEQTNASIPTIFYPLPHVFVAGPGVMANLSDPNDIVLKVFNHLYPNDSTINDRRRALLYLVTDINGAPSGYSTASPAEQRARIARMTAYVTGMTQAFIK